MQFLLVPAYQILLLPSKDLYCFIESKRAKDDSSVKRPSTTVILEFYPCHQTHCCFLQNTFSNNHTAADPSQRPCLDPQAAATVLFHISFSQTDQPEALAAVTVPVPSVRKQGFNFAIVSKLLPCRGCSSVLTSIGPEKQSVILTGGSNHTHLCQISVQDKREHMPYCF